MKPFVNESAENYLEKIFNAEQKVTGCPFCRYRNRIGF